MVVACVQMIAVKEPECLLQASFQDSLEQHGKRPVGTVFLEMERLGYSHASYSMYAFLAKGSFSSRF